LSPFLTNLTHTLYTLSLHDALPISANLLVSMLSRSSGKGECSNTSFEDIPKTSEKIFSYSGKTWSSNEITLRFKSEHWSTKEKRRRSRCLNWSKSSSRKGVSSGESIRITWAIRYASLTSVFVLRI